MSGEDDWITVSSRNGTRLFSARSIGGTLYELPVQVTRGQAILTSVQYWHEALAYSSPQSWSHARERYPNGNILPPRPHKFFCEACAQSNARNIAPPPTQERSKVPFDLVHTDLAAPFSVQFLGGSHYYMTLIDAGTRYTYIYFIKKKSDAVKYLKEFCELVFNRTNKYPRIIRSDRGGEHVNKEYTDYCSSKGIEHQLTPAHSPQSNAVAERFNLTFANMSRTALLLGPQFL